MNLPATNFGPILASQLKRARINAAKGSDELALEIPLPQQLPHLLLRLSFKSLIHQAKRQDVLPTGGTLLGMPMSLS
jgi:hypothetical protein